MRRILVLSLLAILVVTGGCTCDTNEPPTAYIDLMTPTEVSTGEAVTFEGHGTDTDGTVVAYRWGSSIDGDLGTRASFESSSLSEGEHTIRLKVQDNNGTWSEEVESTIMVGAASIGPTEEGAFESEPWAPSEASTPTALPYINYFTADPAIISLGGSSIISWDVSNAETVTVSYGMFVNAVPPVGTATAQPTVTTTYTLTATSGASTVSATVTVSVEGGGPAPTGAGLPVINSFTASPGTIAAGGSSTLSYDVSNADSITFSSIGGTKVSTLLHSSGSWSVEPTSTTTYIITATNAAGSVTETAKVTVQTPDKTVNLSLVTLESGSVSSDHVAGSKLITGDSGFNKTFWAYFSFNISTLAGKKITKAELIYTPTSFNGRPWPNLVSLGIYQVNHGPRALMGSDFVFVGPAIAEGISQIQTILPVDVTSQVQSAATARAPRFQVRLNFLRITNSDGEPDNTGWTSTDAKLRVTYR